jgi:hypothetical protein
MFPRSLFVAQVILRSQFPFTFVVYIRTRKGKPGQESQNRTSNGTGRPELAKLDIKNGIDRTKNRENRKGGNEQAG